MLKLEKRLLSFQEALCSVISGEVVPAAYEASIESGWKPGAREIKYRLKKRRRISQLVPTSPSTISVTACSKKPTGLLLTEWIEDHLDSKRGVVACIPGRPAVAITSGVACGRASYWLNNLESHDDIFNVSKTHRNGTRNRLVFEANMLSSGVPAFLPEGDAFGLHPAETDEFLDAGVSVVVRKSPYGSDEPLCFSREAKRISLCATEMAYTVEMVERNLSPCIVASFFVYNDTDESQSDLGESPLATVILDPPKQKSMFSGMVTVNQISTFNLADLMRAITNEPVKSKQDHISGVLLGACSSIFSVLRKMTEIYDGRAMVKLNLTPNNIVFCPKLIAEDNRWQLGGVGFMPVSESFLDGVPKLTDFNAAFTSRIRRESYSPETSYVMHCLLLVASTRSMHGPFVSSVLWDHLLADGDPSGFVKAAKAMQSKTTNAGAFLAALAANPEMREHAELAKALAEVVSDVDFVVRNGVVSADGSLNVSPSRPMFGKLVSIVTSTSSADTKLFERYAEVDDTEQAHIRALEEVKAARMNRLFSQM